MENERTEPEEGSAAWLFEQSLRHAHKSVHGGTVDDPAGSGLQEAQLAVAYAMLADIRYRARP